MSARCPPETPDTRVKGQISLAGAQKCPHMVSASELATRFKIPGKAQNLGRVQAEYPAHNVIPVTSFFFLGLHLLHLEAPRLGVDSSFQMLDNN